MCEGGWRCQPLNCSSTCPAPWLPCPLPATARATRPTCAAGLTPVTVMGLSAACSTPASPSWAVSPSRKWRRSSAFSVSFWSSTRLATEGAVRAAVGGEGGSGRPQTATAGDRGHAAGRLRPAVPAPACRPAPAPELARVLHLKLAAVPAAGQLAAALHELRGGKGMYGRRRAAAAGRKAACQPVCADQSPYHHSTPTRPPGPASQPSPGRRTRPRARPSGAALQRRRWRRRARRACRAPPRPRPRSQAAWRAPMHQQFSKEGGQALK